MSWSDSLSPSTSASATEDFVIPSNSITNNITLTIGSGSNYNFVLEALWFFIALLILIGSMVVKIPQIAKIIKAESTEGISFEMVYLEYVVDAISLAFNFRMHFPVNSYFEQVFLMGGNMFIMYLFFKFTYKKKALERGIKIGFVAATFVTLLCLMSPDTSSMHTVILFKLASLFLYILSRLPQIYMNHRFKNTYNLDSFMFMLPIVGSILRLITTIAEDNANPLNMFGFSASVVLNTIIFFQIRNYQKQMNQLPFVTNNHMQELEENQMLIESQDF